MSEKIKSVLMGALSLTTLLLTVFLWQQPALLAVSLFAVSMAMILLENHRSALIIYIVAFFFGPFAEILVIYFGAWHYSSPHFLGVPFWLPFLWGNTALFLNRLNIFARLLLKSSKELSEEKDIEE